MTGAPHMRVRLRDVTLADADLLDDWNRQGSQSEFNDFGEEFRPAPRDVLADGPLRNEHNGLLMVELVQDESLVGTVSWHRVRYGPNPESDAWNCGIELLFETYDLNRVEASTDVENVAEQRSLEKAGFVREGIQRRAQYRAGGYHDLVTYSRLRDDPD